MDGHKIEYIISSRGKLQLVVDGYTVSTLLFANHLRMNENLVQSHYYTLWHDAVDSDVGDVEGMQQIAMVNFGREIAIEIYGISSTGWEFASECMESTIMISFNYDIHFIP